MQTPDDGRDDVADATLAVTPPATADSGVSAPIDRSRRMSVLRILLEVALISTGVFLALMGEQWREHAQHRALAEESLRRFRSEFLKNRDAVAAVRVHHETGLKKIQAYLDADPNTREQLGFPFDSTHPAFLEYTAWEVALATQSLAYIESDLAHAISHVYAVQRQLDDLTHDITQVMYQKAGEPDPSSFLASMAVYFDDCNHIEPRLIALYDELLPQLDRALGESSVEQRASNGTVRPEDRE